MKKILMIVLNNFVNDSRIIKEANTLGMNGYEVIVLALHKDGLELKERFDFFSVERIHLVSRNKLSNTNQYIQFIKYIEFYNKCIKRATTFKPDIVHCHDMSSLPIGRKIQKITNCKFVYDSHELWSHMSRIKKHPKFLLFVRNMLESKIARKTDLIITVSDSISKKLREEFSIQREVVVLRNIPLMKKLNEKQNLLREKNNIPEDKKILLYQGGIEKGRGIELLIQAIPMIDTSIVVVILGNGTFINELRKIAYELGVENRTYFNAAVDQTVLLSYTNSADLGITLTENTCLNHYYSLPNKIFEYIQAGIPILCSNFPEMKKIVYEYGLGQVVNPLDVDSIAVNVNNLLSDQDKISHYKSNCLKAKKILNWENEQKILLFHYKELSI